MKKIENAADYFIAILLIFSLVVLLHYTFNFEVAVETFMTAAGQLEWRKKVILGSSFMSLFLLGSFFLKAKFV